MRDDLYLIDRGQSAHPDVYDERTASGSVPFGGDLLRHPGPTLPREPIRTPFLGFKVRWWVLGWIVGCAAFWWMILKPAGHAFVSVCLYAAAWVISVTSI